MGSAVARRGEYGVHDRRNDRHQLVTFRHTPADEVFDIRIVGLRSSGDREVVTHVWREDSLAAERIDRGRR